MIKGKIDSGDIKNKSLYSPNNIASKHMTLSNTGEDPEEANNKRF